MTGNRSNGPDQIEDTDRGHSETPDKRRDMAGETILTLAAAANSSRSWMNANRASGLAPISRSRHSFLANGGRYGRQGGYGCVADEVVSPMRSDAASPVESTLI
jgi:hypothetical protein